MLCSVIRTVGDVCLIVLEGRLSTNTQTFFFSSRGFFFDKTDPEEFIYPVNRQILTATAAFAFIVSSASADLFPTKGPITSGKVARLRFGHAAAAPKNAPLPVKRAIWAGNQL